MRALFSFDEALSPGALTGVFQIVSAFIGLLAIIGAISVVTAINTPNFFSSIVIALGMLGGGMAAILLLRLVGEIWMAQLRIQDRIAILVEQGKR